MKRYQDNMQELIKTNFREMQLQMQEPQDWCQNEEIYTDQLVNWKMLKISV